jgi:hypothetical protein
VGKEKRPVLIVQWRLGMPHWQPLAQTERAVRLSLLAGVKLMRYGLKAVRNKSDVPVQQQSSREVKRSQRSQGLMTSGARSWSLD